MAALRSFRCATCGGSLERLSAAGRCPECGEPYTSGRESGEGPRRDRVRRVLDRIDLIASTIVMLVIGLAMVAVFVLYVL